jgi:hypothetical protein
MIRCVHAANKWSLASRAPVPPLYAIPTGAAKAPALRTFYAPAATNL